MRIGVICEGPTDYPAIKHFMGAALLQKGIDAAFIPLFPQMDRTRPEGGWASVLLWLNNNPPEARMPTYFDGGLFGGALSIEPLDAIIIQLDTDVIEDRFFKSFVHKHYGYDVIPCDEPRDRAVQIENVLAVAAKLASMTTEDRKRHVLTPAVEATETWCVAAFHAQQSDYQRLRGEALVTAFMTALEQSEGRNPQASYVHINKDVTRRDRFCERHSAGAIRIEKVCDPFAEALKKLVELAA